MLNRPNSVRLPLPLALQQPPPRIRTMSAGHPELPAFRDPSSALGSISGSQHLELRYHPLQHGDWTGCFGYPLCSREDSEVEVRFSGVQGSNLPTSMDIQYLKILRASRGTPASLVHRLELSRNSFLYTFLSLAIKGLALAISHVNDSSGYFH